MESPPWCSQIPPPRHDMFSCFQTPATLSHVLGGQPEYPIYTKCEIVNSGSSLPKLDKFERGFVQRSVLCTAREGEISSNERRTSRTAKCKAPLGSDSKNCAPAPRERVAHVSGRIAPNDPFVCSSVLITLAGWSEVCATLPRKAARATNGESSVRNTSL